jgi:hypothetical protein
MPKNRKRVAEQDCTVPPTLPASALPSPAKTEQDEIARLRAENDRLRAKMNNPLSFKVSEKGCVSVYGLHSVYPVSLYRDQWLRLADAIPALKDFIAKNGDRLRCKNPVA